MATTYATKLVPLDEAIAQLDSPEAVADRRKRALARAEALVDNARARVIHGAGTAAINVALDPLKKGLGLSPSAAEVHRGRNRGRPSRRSSGA